MLSDTPSPKIMVQKTSNTNMGVVCSSEWKLWALTFTIPTGFDRYRSFFERDV